MMFNSYLFVSRSEIPSFSQARESRVGLREDAIRIGIREAKFSLINETNQKYGTQNNHRESLGQPGIIERK